MAGCGRLHFDDAAVDASIDAGPTTIRIGERPGATSLGTEDTYLDPLTPDIAHGLQLGLQCDVPDVALIRFTFPAGVPGAVMSATLRIGVTSDRLESGVVEVREMLADWSEAESTWNSQRTGVSWQTPGAGGTYAAPFGTFDGRNLFSDYAVSVPTDVVDRWWSGTSFGIAITVSASGVNLGAHENVTNPELRPELEITYVPR